MHPQLHKIVRRVYYKIPFRLRLWAGRALFFPLDAFRRARSAKPLPPSIRKLVGPGDFAAIGAATVAQLISDAGLQPEDAFLDIGCGIGRVALPLTTYLLPSTPFAGFDVVPEFIAWCNENISSRHPNFRFDLIDVANSEYNRGGAFDAAGLRFPFPDAAFAFAYAGSVFTHLLPAAAENYIRETARVLRPQGTLAATFFLLNDESRALIDSGQAHMPLRTSGAGFRVLDAGNPEADVGLEEAWIREVFAAAGLAITSIRYGSWCGRREFADYQDLIIAKRIAD
jgi:SAM-dependent methyltransferase